MEKGMQAKIAMMEIPSPTMVVLNVLKILDGLALEVQLQRQMSANSAELGNEKQVRLATMAILPPGMDVPRFVQLKQDGTAMAPHRTPADFAVMVSGSRSSNATTGTQLHPTGARPA